MREPQRHLGRRRRPTCSFGLVWMISIIITICERILWKENLVQFSSVGVEGPQGESKVAAVCRRPKRLRSRGHHAPLAACFTSSQLYCKLKLLRHMYVRTLGMESFLGCNSCCCCYSQLARATKTARL